MKRVPPKDLGLHESKAPDTRIASSLIRQNKLCTQQTHWITHNAFFKCMIYSMYS